MKKNLTFKELIFVASMLFGMFFGAGNLIFPIFMGQLAGHHVWAASAGVLYTPPVTPWESVTPEVSDPTVRRELPKVGPITGVKS